MSISTLLFIFCLNVLLFFYRAHGTPLAIYKDTKADVSLVYQPELSKTDTKSWNVLGARAERNKENNAIPTKWTSNKVSFGILWYSTVQFACSLSNDVITSQLSCIPHQTYYFQIPRRAVPRTGGATASACIEIFVDEECAEWVINTFFRLYIRRE